MNLPAPHVTILPRLLRLRDAPAYLGMDRNRFSNEVRPFVTTIPVGKQGIAFDRLELDVHVRVELSIPLVEEHARLHRHDVPDG